MEILVTGGAGFIGSRFIQWMIQAHPGIKLHNVDALTYAGHLANTKSFQTHPGYTFHHVDITNKAALESIFAAHSIEAVIHFAAESHVDNSIKNSTPFVLTNVLGTQILLDVAKAYQVQRFVHVSTDEVYGELGPEGYFTEETPLTPNSPYSASKAGSDLMVRAYYETFGFPALITRCTNNYGPHQFLEKLIPLMITRAKADQPLPVYGKGLQIRDWLHVDDHCRAIDLVLQKGRLGEVYNIGGYNEKTNIEVVKTILKHLGKPESLITYVPDRLGHDFRYAMDPTKITTELGWKPQYTFETGIAETIEWYATQTEWLSAVTVSKTSY
jgi:dTDP-glucose 4,6-dehydratase